MNKDIYVPLLITPILFSNTGRSDISESNTVSLALESGQTAFTPWSLPPLRVFVSGIAVSLWVPVRFPYAVRHCLTRLECDV